MSMVRVHKVVYAILTLNFWIPVLFYIFDPAGAVASFGGIGEVFGMTYAHSEDSVLWWVLGIANVSTLGFCCALLWWDVRRWFSVLVPLVYLKSWASIGFGAYFVLVESHPAYLAACLFDGITVVTMIASAVAAKRELDSGIVGLHNLIVRKPEVVLDTLGRLKASGRIERVPNLWQIALGAMYMRYRLIFRSDTVGLGPNAKRTNLRARLMAIRPIRAPFLLWEQVIAPFEMTGLSLSPAFLERHLLGAFHQLDHGMYDMELLSLHEGALEQLREKAVEAAEGKTARARWLQDLCVYEGYHADLVTHVDRALAGDFSAQDTEIVSDTTLAGYLAWCADQPQTPAATWKAWQQGAFHLDPRRVQATSTA